MKINPLNRLLILFGALIILVFVLDMEQTNIEHSNVISNPINTTNAMDDVEWLLNPALNYIFYPSYYYSYPYQN